MNDIRLVKLSTGEELVCETSPESSTIKVSDVDYIDDILVLKNCCQIGVDPESGRPSFIPYPMFIKQGEPIKVNRSFIIFDVPVSDSVAQAHCKAFGKIIEPPKSIITI